MVLRQQAALKAYSEQAHAMHARMQAAAEVTRRCQLVRAAFEPWACTDCCDVVDDAPGASAVLSRTARIGCVGGASAVPDGDGASSGSALASS